MTTYQNYIHDINEIIDSLNKMKESLEEKKNKNQDSSQDAFVDTIQVNMEIFINFKKI